MFMFNTSNLQSYNEDKHTHSLAHVLPTEFWECVITLGTNKECVSELFSLINNIKWHYFLIIYN